MKFKLVEKFIDLDSLRMHFEKHGNEFNPPFYNIEDYEKSATDLAKHWPGAGLAKDPDANYVGYQSKNKHFILYNKISESLVIFNLPSKGKDIFEEPLVISYYTLPYNIYLNKLNSNNLGFEQELPQNLNKAIELKAAEKKAKEAKELEIKKRQIALDKLKAGEKYAKKFNNKGKK